MNPDRDLKRAVLQGVYEENRGIPRSDTGKRLAKEPPPAPPRETPSPARRTRLYGIAGILTLAALVGLTVRDASRLEFASEVSATTADSQPLDQAAGTAGIRPVENPDASPAAPSGSPEATAGPTIAVPVATSGQYNDMLNDLPIPVAELFDLSVQTIVIDPGHGGNDPGAIGHQGLMEKEVTLDIARRLRARLEAAGPYRVVLTREDDRKIQLKDRVAFAKDNDADLFISIHINSVPDQAGQVNYVETYFFGPHSDQRTLDLAKKENQNSEYAMGDFRQVIARIGDTLKTEESAQLATSIHQRLYTNLKRHSPGLLDAGAKSGPFVVLLGVEVPSVLVEVSCISNEAEALRLASPAYRESIASYLQTGIVDYLENRDRNESVNGVNSAYVAK
jgi:N-acetylmuramoyl-L-alanine amidase